MTIANKELASEVQNLPLLTAEREKELGKVIQANEHTIHREDAIVELVQHNMRLAISEANKYSRNFNMPVEELFNAGRAGLIKAAYGYDPNFNTRFSTYAIPWIRQGIRELMHGNSPVKIPLHIINGKYKKAKILAEKGDITDREVCEELELTDAQMDKINLANVSSICLDMTIKEDSNTTVSDIIADQNAVIPGETGLDDIRYDYLEDALSDIDEISQAVIRSQIMESDKVTLYDIGKKYGITGERVRQIKEKALKELKNKIIYRMKLDGHTIRESASVVADGLTKKKRGRPRKNG